MPPSPPPIDIEQAQASQSSSSGRRSARLAGESGPSTVWGHDPEAEARRNREQNPSGITSFLTSIISPGSRGDSLPVHEPTAGQAPNFASAASVRNTPPPPPPRQPRGSTSVPPASAAATPPAPERSQQLSGSSSPLSQPQEPVGEPVPSSSTPPQRGATNSTASTSEQQDPHTESDSVSSRLAGNVNSVETRSQPPSSGDRTATQSPNMSQPSQSNGRISDNILQQVSLWWNEASEEDQNKLPSKLNLLVQDDLFRPALSWDRTSEIFPNCGHCHRSMMDNQDDIRYVRCSHAMHMRCIQQGGLDNGCPVCPTQSTLLESRPAPEGITCDICSSTLTSNDILKVLGCGHTLHKDCMSRGAAANGCPFCRLPISTYGAWQEFQIPSPQPQQDDPIRNQERDRLLGELFHIHPTLWHLFEDERLRLRDIETIASFDLDRLLHDFRTYHNGPEGNEEGILNLLSHTDHNLQLGLHIDDYQLRELQSSPLDDVFYASIRTTLCSLMEGNMDEDSARSALDNANQIRPGSCNRFLPSFWLPHERMRRRAIAEHDRENVKNRMRRYIHKYHRYHTIEGLFQPTQENNRNREPSGNGTTQANGRQRRPSGDSNDREQQANGRQPSGDSNNGEQQADIEFGSPVFAEPRIYPRPGWVYDNGTEKQIRGYREIGNGFQVLLRTPAPRRGFWDHELVASHLVGGEIAINAYKTACEEQGEEEFKFEEGSLDLLRTKTRSQVRIASRSVFRRYGYPPAGGYLNAPMQHLEVKFTDEEGTFWYRKSRLEEKFTFPFIRSLLEGLYEASGMSPVSFSPSETRQRRPGNRRSGNANTSTEALPVYQSTSPTTPQRLYPPRQPDNPTAPEGSSVEARLARLEQMIAQLLAREGGHPSPENVNG